ncbi:MAG: methyl-accepting chemotaxis protein [Massilia sp.]
MLGKLRIGPKLLLAPAAVLLLLIALAGIAWFALQRQNESLETLVRQRAPQLRAATELVAESQLAHTEVYQLLAWQAASFSAARIEPLVAGLRARHRAIERRFDVLNQLTPAGSAEQRLVEQAEAAHASYVKAVEDVIELARVDQSLGATAMSKAQLAFGAVAGHLSELARREQARSEQASNSARTNFHAIGAVMPLVIVLSIALSLLITFMVRRALLREVGEIGQSALDLASGNLMVKEKVYGSDEISDTSRALDASIRHLNTTLQSIFASARSIDSVSREIAAGSAELSCRAGEQATSLGHTASSVEALSATVSKTASRALVANRLAASASSVALKGGDMVEQLVTTLATIKGSSQAVVDIAAAIDAIASETNVLALNAAFEAARAGDSGRSFAQAADQVRALAQRSGEAARQIKALVAASVAEIDGGSLSVTAAGDSMVDIAVSVRQVGDLINQISQASEVQASGISEVSQAIVEMDHMTQQNSARVDEAAAAAASLQQQADSLARAVARFRLDEALLQMPPAPARAAGRHLRLASRRD